MRVNVPGTGVTIWSVSMHSTGKNEGSLTVFEVESDSVSRQDFGTNGHFPQPNPGEDDRSCTLIQLTKLMANCRQTYLSLLPLTKMVATKPRQNQGSDQGL